MGNSRVDVEARGVQPVRTPELNRLEGQVAISNQNIVLAEAQYRQARALVDTAALLEALSMLAANALEATPEGGHIRVSARRNRGGKARSWQHELGQAGRWSALHCPRE